MARCATTLLTLTPCISNCENGLLHDDNTTHAGNSKGTDTFFRRDGSCWCCRSPREPMTKVRRLHLMVLPVSPYFERNSGPERHQLTTEMLKASATYLLLFNAPAPTPTTQRVTIPSRHTLHRSSSLLHSNILQTQILVTRTLAGQNSSTRGDSRWMRVNLRTSIQQPS